MSQHRIVDVNFPDDEFSYLKGSSLAFCHECGLIQTKATDGLPCPPWSKPEEKKEDLMPLLKELRECLDKAIDLFDGDWKQQAATNLLEARGITRVIIKKYKGEEDGKATRLG